MIIPNRVSMDWLHYQKGDLFPDMSTALVE